MALMLVALPASAQPTIQPDDAASHIGQEVIVEGQVPTVVCSPLACLLSFTTDYSGLVASIPGDVVTAFPPPRETYSSRRVRVRGTVFDKSGRPRIEVRDPADLQVLDGPSGAVATSSHVSVPWPPKSDEDGDDDASAARAEAAVAAIGSSDGSARTSPPPAQPEDAGDDESEVEPLAAAPPPPPPAAAAPSGGGAPRSRIVDPGRVTSRVGGPRPPTQQPSGPSVVSGLRGGDGDAATVEAMSLRQQVAKLEEANRALTETVEQLRERLDLLEQQGGPRFAGMDDAPLPEIPDYVVSGQSATRLQHVKKGWSSERVLRTLGAPLHTMTEANGFMTWYYSNGRAVTLDPRGRVSSSIGF